MKRLMLLAAMAVALAGCNTVRISSPGSLAGVNVKGAKGQADRVIYVANEGYYFLWEYPIVAGNMTDWNQNEFGISNTVKWGSHETSLQKLYEVMYRYAEHENCDVTDIVVNDRAVSRIGLWSVEGWINGLVGLRPISVSGVLVPRK